MFASAQKLLLLFCALHCLLFFDAVVDARMETFDAMDRKSVYTGDDGKQYKWAMFDADGIMTFNGELNGRSNDLTLAKESLESWEQKETCEKEPTLMIEMCETERKGPWIGLILCYESQLSRKENNPFFRIRHLSEMDLLVNAICGESQSALFINRTVNESEVMTNGGGKYEPFYVLYPSFAPHKKIYFQMRDKRFEKQCALLTLGGENLLGVKLTDLRRNPMPMYKPESGMIKQWNATSDDFLQEFPDMGNRKNRLSNEQGLELMLVDFLPVAGTIQNISIYGWLPMKIKLLSKSIDPCKTDWKLLESREFRNRQGTLEIEYTVRTDISKEAGDQKGTNAQSGSNTGTNSGGGGGLKLEAVVALSAETNFQNTEGSQQMSGTDFSISNQISKTTAIERTETVAFAEYEGAINIEQMIYTCHGIKFYPDIIRYQDDEGRVMLPDETKQPELAPQAPVQTGEPCGDLLEECKIWAQKGYCRTQATHMMLNCKKSCQLCPKVNTNAKPLEIIDITVNDICDDLDNSCVGMAADGECSKNPLQMSGMCRRSCGLCDAEADHDEAAEEAVASRKDV